MHCCSIQQHIKGVSTCDSYTVSQTKLSVDVVVQVDDLGSIEKAKLSVDVAIQVDDLRSIEKAKLSVDEAVQVDDLRSIEKPKLSVDVAVQVDDLRNIENLSQHDSGRLAEGNCSLVLFFFVYCLVFDCIYCILFLANYCDLETAENEEEQQQMLKKIERAKDVQIFNLERKLIQKSHVGKQHAVQISVSMYAKLPSCE